MKNSFDFKTHNIPANNTARLVILEGVNYEIEKKDVNLFHSEIPSYEIQNLEKFKTNPEFIDFTGKRHGTFTVIGLTVKIKSSGSWLCRCDCGQYEIRTSKCLKNFEKSNRLDIECCLSCKDNIKLKKMASAKALEMDYKEYCKKFIYKETNENA